MKKLAILLPYQQKILNETHAVSVWEKSRRIGLSWAAACKATLHAGAGLGNVYYQAYNQDMTQTFIADVADWAKTMDIACSEVEEGFIENEREQILRYRVTFNSGKYVQALPSTPRVLRSKGVTGDIYILDEAAFCDDLDELLKAAMAMTVWGGQVMIISTHNGADNPFANLVDDIRSDRQQYALHRITLDDAIAQGLAQRIFQKTKRKWFEGADQQWRDEIIALARSADDIDEEFLCIPKQSGGAYFSRALIESRMHPAAVMRFNGSADFNMLPEHIRAADMRDWLQENLQPLVAELTLEQRHFIGMDFARSGDLSVITPMAQEDNLHLRVPFMLEMHNVPHMQQLQALRFIIDRVPRFTGGAIDAGGNGSYIAEAAHDAYGSKIEQLKFTENWYRENMPKYKAAFEDATITIPKHAGLLDDHRAFKLIRGVPRLPQGKTDKSGERHGDGAIACALAFYAANADYVPMIFLSGGQKTAASAIMSDLNHMSMPQ